MSKLSKCVNYINEPASQPVFAVFIVIWTYFRHYLNLVILWSVWTEFKLIPYVISCLIQGDGHYMRCKG
jgi:acyl-CoA-dependent ceramide synthase